MQITSSSLLLACTLAQISMVITIVSFFIRWFLYSVSRFNYSLCVCGHILLISLRVTGESSLQYSAGQARSSSLRCGRSSVTSFRASMPISLHSKTNQENGMLQAHIITISLIIITGFVSLPVAIGGFFGYLIAIK